MLRDFRRLPVSVKYVFWCDTRNIVCLFPWFQSDQLVSVDGRLQRVADVESGLGVFPIFGFLSCFSVGHCSFYPSFSWFVKTFGIRDNVLWTIFGSLAMYTLLINIFVFSSVMQNDSTAQIRFGLFSTLFFHAFVVLVDTLRFGKNRKRSA